MAGWKSAEMGTHLVQEFCRFCRESKRLRQLLRDTRRCFREINSVRGADGSKSRFHMHSRWFCSFWNGPFTQTSVISDPKITSNNPVWAFAANIWQLSLKHCVDLLLMCDVTIAVCFRSHWHCVDACLIANYFVAIDLRLCALLIQRLTQINSLTGTDLWGSDWCCSVVP